MITNYVVINSEGHTIMTFEAESSKIMLDTDSIIFKRNEEAAVIIPKNFIIMRKYEYDKATVNSAKTQ